MPASAPQGTRQSPVHGGLWQRIRHEHEWFIHSHHRLSLPGLHRPIRVLHLTDIHIRGDAPWLAQLCEEIQGTRPDLIALTGDIVTRGWQVDAVDRLLDALPRPRLGSWAVMGNWEYWSGANPEDWAKRLAAHGVRLLMNEHQHLDEITVVGVDDMLAGNPDPERSLASSNAGPTLVLTHSPALFPRLVRPNVDLVLCGHSHGGQLRLPGLGALWVPRGTGHWVAGWYHLEDTHMFVSRGIGWSVAPIRLWCPPEIALIELIPAESPAPPG